MKRQQATEELEYLGKIAKPQLEKALANRPSLEAHRRLFLTPVGDMTPRQVIVMARRELVMPEPDEILRQVEKVKATLEAPSPPVPSAWARAVAAIRVLERVGNNEAQELLRMVASGDDEALPTVEAQSALNRLKAKAK